MRLFCQLRALFRRENLDAEMAEELRTHLEMQEADNRAGGMSAEEARYAARRQFGGLEQVKERARDQRAFGWLRDLGQDLRYGARQLRRNPGFTGVIAVTLALGIGLNTVVFTFYGAIMLKPLAVRAPQEVGRIVTVERGRWSDAMLNYAEFEDLRTRARSFRDVILTSEPQFFSLTRSDASAGSAEAVTARLVSDNYFPALGVVPVLGRAFGADDAAVCILSHQAWQRRFQGDPAVLGRTLLVQNVAVAIVGVAPETFGGTGRPNGAPDLWLPLALQPAVLPSVDWRHDDAARPWQVLVRRRPDVTLAQANAELDVLARAWIPPGELPPSEANRTHWVVRPATNFEFDYLEFKAVCAVFMLAVALILVIAGVNVVNLIAARNATRERELAIRLALGAGRRRIVRQLCTESVLLGLLGGAGGLVLSWWACGAIHAIVLREMEAIIPGGSWSLFLDLTPDWRVLAYTTGVSLLAGIGVGLWPAWRATGVDLESGLKQDASGLGRASRGPWSRRNLLLTTQVALCLMLLAAAGLLFRGATHARTTEPGFDSKHLLVLLKTVPETAVPSAAARQTLMHRAVDRLQTLAGITSVSWATRVPYLGHGMSPVKTDDGVAINGCVLNDVAANYLETLGVRLVAGRGFTTWEQDNRARVVLISESAARQLWPGQNPLGRRLADYRRDWYTVVGVVRDARFTLLSQTDKADLFYPAPLVPDDMLLVRTRGAPESAFQSVFSALRDADVLLPSQALVMSMEGGPMRLQRLMAGAPAAFASLLGLLALVLAAVGLYGVVSFLVARRTREFGVHLALGATSGDVLRLVLRQTLGPVAWGVMVGFAGAIALAVLITRLVLNPEIPDLTYGAGAFPSGTLAGVIGLLLAVIFLAAFIPARRATKVDPMVALRAE